MNLAGMQANCASQPYWLSRINFSLPHARFPTHVTHRRVGCGSGSRRTGRVGGLLDQFGTPGAKKRGHGLPRWPYHRIAAKAENVELTFELHRRVDFGMGHKIVGNYPTIGDWNPAKAPDMQWSNGDVWKVSVQVAPATHLEFKVVMTGNPQVEWEQAANHVLEVPEDAADLQITLAWAERPAKVKGAASPLDGSSSGGSTSSPALAGSEGAEASSLPILAEQEGNSAPPSNGAAPSADFPAAPPDAADASKEAGGGEPRGSGDAGQERLAHQQWQGPATTFMRSNDHTRERKQRWDTSRVQGTALAIVEGDRDAPNWLSKMQLVRKVLLEEAPSLRPELDSLAYAYIYLQWISTGAIECVEGGGHFRPNRHAEVSRDMFRSLEWLLGDEGSSGPSRVLARKLHTKLPSFTEQFTRSTPLTRIRDIAHRNDIPHELKQEIKHTIQNKLHRNAGPEDLVATETLLDLITGGSYGDVSHDAIKELRVFLAELRDFFNAGSLQDMLDGIRPALDPPSLQEVDRFLEAKSKAEATGNAADDKAKNDVMELLHALTSLRASISSKLASGLRNDAPDEAIAMRQKFRLCEIRLEEFAFVVLSRFLNLLEQQGGAKAVAEGGERSWALPLGATLLAVRQLGLGGWEPRECMAVENELRAWQAAGTLATPEGALRLKATVERVQRLAGSYTDLMLSIFPERVSSLGAGLQIEEERVQVFAEAEIRANVVFQISKLCTLLLEAVRMVTGTPAWEVLVSGEAVGKLVEVGQMDPASLAEQLREAAVVVVRSASGDEELGSAGPNLKAVVLCHSLPHLSHLGVRARQEKVVFVASEDSALVDSQVRCYLGKRVKVRAGSIGVEVEEVAEGEAPPESPVASQAAPTQNGNGAAPSGNGTHPVGPLRVNLGKGASLVALEGAQLETCGGKASACASLSRLATSWRAPAGVCFPFGNMEAAIQEAEKEADFQRLLEEVETAETEGGALDAACDRLQALVASVRPPRDLLRQACAFFGGDALLIARSSANVEDLAGMSGAGLYDSLPNVPASDPEALGKAVASVWASLYTRRAILSRRAAGVRQADASMAVLVQEQVAPDLCFVLHTVSPLDHDPQVLYAELAVGLGETLASGSRGTPWRLSVNKKTGEVKTLSFANFSLALLASKVPALVAASGPSPAAGESSSPLGGSVTVDYSKQALSTSEERRQQVGEALAKVGAALETAFGGPQDVEGAFVGDTLYIVQTRPQP